VKGKGKKRKAKIKFRILKDKNVQEKGKECRRTASGIS
jgi:hypothetical protein